ncbi:MAG: hypothetical protein RR034_07005, partial [Bacteroidales bacterium]
MKIVRLIPIVIFALAIIISSCEKEKVIQDDIFNSLKNNDLHNYAKTKVYFIRGHKYVEINGINSISEIKSGVADEMPTFQ